MIFYRITYTDHKGFVENQWFCNNAAAMCAASWINGAGQVDVLVEPVSVPDGDPAWLRWLNENPNTPNLKDGTMHSTTSDLADLPGMPKDFPRVNEFPEPATTLKLHPTAAARAELGKPLDWAAPTKVSALDVQEGGSHYKNLKIQPIEYIHANGIPFAEGSVIKYVTRWREKGGIKDLEKARHFIDLLIELEQKAAA